MRYLCDASTAGVAALAFTLLLAGPAAGQGFAPATKTGATKPYTPPKTVDGVPDFQGVWTNNTVTPLQRPKGLGAKEFYTEAELAENQKKEKERLALNEEDGRPTEPGTAADVHYDFSEYGLDRAQAKQTWNRRTSLIVGPEGTIPPTTPEARARIAANAAKAKGHEADSSYDRPLSAQCLLPPHVGPPLMPAGYNSNFQIVQGSGYIVIVTEMNHDARVIPTDGRTHALNSNVRQWMGNSVGHWEGNTLVIDTTNFTERAPYNGAQNLHVVERFNRVDPDTILYQFTVEDPGMWTKPWSGEIPISKVNGQMYEFACHEGNYGLANTLRGFRVEEEEAAGKK